MMLHLCHSCQGPPLAVQSKLAESEDKVAAMAVQLEQVNADRLRLENRNSVLEKVGVHVEHYAAVIHHLPALVCLNSAAMG